MGPIYRITDRRRPRAVAAALLSTVAITGVLTLTALMISGAAAVLVGAAAVPLMVTVLRRQRRPRPARPAWTARGELTPTAGRSDSTRRVL
jgi:hypothetical protein